MVKKTLLLSVAILLSACGPGMDKPTVPSTHSCRIADFGQGVYYFDCAYEFGDALAVFRKSHEIIAITSYAGGDMGTSGYWVITKQ